MTTQPIPEDQVSVDVLERIFTAAELENHVDEDGDLVVKSEEGDWTVVIVIDDDRKLLAFRSYSLFKEGVSTEDRRALVNTLNDEVIFARFCASDEDLLVADYFLSFEEGLSVYQVLRSLRWFVQASRDGIAEHDDDDLVQ